MIPKDREIDNTFCPIHCSKEPVPKLIIRWVPFLKNTYTSPMSSLPIDHLYILIFKLWSAVSKLMSWTVSHWRFKFIWNAFAGKLSCKRLLQPDKICNRRVSIKTDWRPTLDSEKTDNKETTQGMGMQIDTTTIEDSMEFLLKTKNIISIWPNSPTTGHIPWENHNWKRHMYPMFTAALFTIARIWK